ncbi:hypothetical protein AAMO2058_001034700 [Amorphochlora amoebiformis]
MIGGPLVRINEMYGGAVWKRAPVTTSLAALCIAPFVRLGGWEWPTVAYSPYITLNETIVTCLTSSFFHLNVTHLRNILYDLITTGLHMEILYGSKIYARNLAISTLLARELHIIYAWLCSKLLGWPTPFHGQSVGLDATTNALKVMGSYSLHQQWIFYGFVSVPNNLRPLGIWLSVLFSMLRDPQVNVSPELSGIFSGLTLVYLPWVIIKVLRRYHTYPHAVRFVNGRIVRTPPTILRIIHILERFVRHQVPEAHRPLEILDHNIHPLLFHMVMAGFVIVFQYGCFRGAFRGKGQS